MFLHYNTIVFSPAVFLRVMNQCVLKSISATHAGIISFLPDINTLVSNLTQSVTSAVITL